MGLDFTLAKIGDLLCPGSVMLVLLGGVVLPPLPFPVAGDIAWIGLTASLEEVGVAFSVEPEVKGNVVGRLEGLIGDGGCGKGATGVVVVLGGTKVEGGGATGVGETGVGVGVTGLTGWGILGG